MKHITYATEKRINEMRKRESLNKFQKMAIRVYDDIFASCGMLGATLKEFETWLTWKLDAKREANVFYFEGLYGIEYMTNGNARYIGTHDLSHLTIDDFNLLVKQLFEN